MRTKLFCVVASLALFAGAADAASIISPGETLDFTFGVASSAGAVGVSTVALAFDPAQPQVLVNPGGYGIFGNLRFDYFETDHGAGAHTISIIITTGAPQGFVPGGLSIGGSPVDTMFFDFGDYFSNGEFGDGIDLPAGFTLESTNYGYFIDGDMVAGPFSTDGFDGGDLVGQAGISTNNGSNIGGYGINGFRIDWDITSSAIVVPLPVGASLGFVGLIALTQRRRRVSL